MSRLTEIKRKMKAAKKAEDARTDALYKAVARYLEANGWKVIVIGGTAVTQDLARATSFNYEFVVRFTGKKVQS